MNKHLNIWLDAYLDGELPASQQALVEDHLAACPQCRALLARRNSLSSLLQTTPSATPRKPAKQFVAEVSVRASHYSHRPQVTVVAPTRFRLFQFAPLILLLAWAFIQSVSMLTFLIGLIPGAGQILEQSAMDLSVSAAFSWLGNSNLAEASLESLGLVLPLDFLSWNWITSLFLLVGGALIYLSWLASWWALARQNHQIEKI